MRKPLNLIYPLPDLDPLIDTLPDQLSRTQRFELKRYWVHTSLLEFQIHTFIGQDKWPMYPIKPDWLDIFEGRHGMLLRETLYRMLVDHPHRAQVNVSEYCIGEFHIRPPTLLLKLV